MNHFQEQAEKPRTPDLLAAKALHFKSLSLPEEKKVWPLPLKELQELKEPLRELLAYVQELEHLLTPAKEHLQELLRKKYLLELQLIPVKMVKARRGSRGSRKKKAPATLTQEEIEFLQKLGPPQILTVDLAQAEQRTAQDKSLTVLSQEDAIYFTNLGSEFRVREFYYTSGELPSPVKAPVSEDISINLLEIMTTSGDWKKIKSSALPELETSEEFLQSLQDYFQLQQELSEDI